MITITEDKPFAELGTTDEDFKILNKRLYEYKSWINEIKKNRYIENLLKKTYEE